MLGCDALIAPAFPGCASPKLELLKDIFHGQRPC
jgi:hypothetical protein